MSRVIQFGAATADGTFGVALGAHVHLVNAFIRRLSDVHVRLHPQLSSVRADLDAIPVAEPDAWTPGATTDQTPH